MLISNSLILKEEADEMYKKIFLLIVLGIILGHSTALADGPDYGDYIKYKL
jgi:hypothetical protein